MAINKTVKGWQVDMRPQGRGTPRIRKSFATKRAALVFETAQKDLANKGEWAPANKNKRTLSDLINDWYTFHGNVLKDGKKRHGKLLAIAARLNNPLAHQLTAEAWLTYRNARLMPDKNGKVLTANNLNHEQTYIAAVYSLLTRIENWKGANPLKGLAKIPMDEPELIFLSLEQLKKLLITARASHSDQLYIRIKLCLATGARWGEVQGLSLSKVHNGKVHFYGTKNSKARSIPIKPKLFAEVVAALTDLGGAFSGNCRHGFELAIERADITLPRGQLTHVLRHSFASHYMINDGNILKLKDTLGHRTLAMTMRYAKLAPAHLVDVLDKNPLNDIDD